MIEEVMDKVMPKTYHADGTFSYVSKFGVMGPYEPGNCECGHGKGHVGKCAVAGTHA
jgi:hypothetical protein